MAEVVEIKGLRELERNINELAEQVRERGVKRMVSAAAVPIRDDARRRAPVLKTPDYRRKPGTLRNSIQIWRKRDTPYAATYFVGVRGLSRRAIRLFKQTNSRPGRAARAHDNPDDPFYWRFVELGTSRRSAQPFLRPAFEGKKRDAVTAMIAEGRRFLTAAAGRLRKEFSR